MLLRFEPNNYSSDSFAIVMLVCDWDNVQYFTSNTTWTIEIESYFFNFSSRLSKQIYYNIQKINSYFLFGRLRWKVEKTNLNLDHPPIALAIVFRDLDLDLYVWFKVFYHSMAFHFLLGLDVAFHMHSKSDCWILFQRALQNTKWDFFKFPRIEQSNLTQQFNFNSHSEEKITTKLACQKHKRAEQGT